MKATIEIPDELYRQVKAKGALEGQTLEEVAIELFRRYVGFDQGSERGHGHQDPQGEQQIDGESEPKWYGVLRSSAQRVERDDMEAVRASIARGIALDRSFRHDSETITQQINTVCDEVDTRPDPFVTEAARRTLAESDW